jgi:REP element-mobilizing transposase RayT
MACKLLSRQAMAYPVRHFEPETIYFLTSRTTQSRLLMTPSPKVNELIGGIFARAVRQCGVELFAYVFTSNHFHAMVRAPSAIAMSKFMQRLQSNIAVKVGRLVGWRGRFFARRYSRRSRSSMSKPTSSASSTSSATASRRAWSLR